MHIAVAINPQIRELVNKRAVGGQCLLKIVNINQRSMFNEDSGPTAKGNGDL